MSETLPQFNGNMTLPDHRRRPDVFGTNEAIGFENALVATGTPEDDPSFQKNMVLARETFQAISSEFPEEAGMVNRFFDEQPDVPELFQQAKAELEAADGAAVTWLDWLGSKASDNQVLNFLQWHSHRHENLGQNPAFQEKLTAQKQAFMEKSEALRKVGFLHEEAVVDEAKMEGLKVEILDVFAQFTGGSGHAADPEGNSITLVENYTDAEFDHESTHALLGKLAEDKFDKNQWLNEAVTEHIARSMKTGKHEAVGLKDRGDGEPGAYPLERDLLSAVLKGGRKEISPKYLTRLYSAKSDSAKIAAKDELRAQFKEAYGDPDLLDKVTAKLAEHADYSNGNYEDMYNDKYVKTVHDIMKNPPALAEDAQRIKFEQSYQQGIQESEARARRMGAATVAGSVEQLQERDQIRQEALRKAGYT